MLDNLNSNFESSKAQRPDANDDEVEIDLLEIFYALKKKILLVLMVALVGGCIAAAYTQFLMTPIYSSTSSILVLPPYRSKYIIISITSKILIFIVWNNNAGKTFVIKGSI